MSCVPVLWLNGEESFLELAGARIFRLHEPMFMNLKKLPGCTFYLVPDGRWVERVDHGKGYENHVERHPVMVAHRFFLYEQPLPNELHVYREDAMLENYGGWLTRNADEMCRIASGRVKPPPLKRSLNRAGKRVCGAFAEELVRNYLRNKNTPKTAPDVVAALKNDGWDIAIGTLRKLAAWKEYRAHLCKDKADPKGKARRRLERVTDPRVLSSIADDILKQAGYDFDDD